MSHIISVTLTDREFSIVKKAAAEKGLTIAQYVKHYPITDDEFNSRYQYLKEQSLIQEIGMPFTVMSIFGEDWSNIPRGIRLSLGRNYYHLVKRGELKNIYPIEKNGSNVQLYVRK